MSDLPESVEVFFDPNRMINTSVNVAKRGEWRELMPGEKPSFGAEFIPADFDAIARWLAGDGALINELNQAIEREVERLDAVGSITAWEGSQ